MLEFLRTTRELVAAQRDVVLGYLGRSGGDLLDAGTLAGLGGAGLGAAGLSALAGPAGVPAALPASRASQPAPRQTSQDGLAGQVGPGRGPVIPAQAAPLDPSPSAGGPAGAGVLGRAAVADVVVEVIGSQTGYPAEMLEPGLDLEADLSIDSIKRTEILGELAGRLGLVSGDGELSESVVEELAAIKTVDGIVDWIVARSAERVGSAAGAAVPAQASPAPAAASTPVAVLGRAAVADVVVEVIGSQTGYPAEMLEPGLDLEADLSIDSIKRTEILGELAGRLGLVSGDGELSESVVEELAAIKTVDGIVDWIVARSAERVGSAAGAAVPAQASPAPAPAAGLDAGPPGAVPVGAVPAQPTHAWASAPALAGVPAHHGFSPAAGGASPSAGGPAGAGVLGRAAVADVVVEVIGSQTGYPAEML
ncbi:phosphopantetheine-binding protein, partial [Frankia nepalensis]|uniref:phosphopantetheine-binding protein n=1 Tax=Frankia nepalensis TaxID=1836974 RepID=UPI00288B88F6